MYQKVMKLLIRRKAIRRQKKVEVRNQEKEKGKEKQEKKEEGNVKKEDAQEKKIDVNIIWKTIGFYMLALLAY